MNTCKDKCPAHKANSSSRYGMYKQGFKHCNTCQLFIEWAGLYCPCCGTRLRSKPRSSKVKKTLCVEINQNQ